MLTIIHLQLPSISVFSSLIRELNLGHEAIGVQPDAIYADRPTLQGKQPGDIINYLFSSLTIPHPTDIILIVCHISFKFPKMALSNPFAKVQPTAFEEGSFHLPLTFGQTSRSYCDRWKILRRKSSQLADKRLSSTGRLFVGVAFRTFFLREVVMSCGLDQILLNSHSKTSSISLQVEWHCTICYQWSPIAKQILLK